jgi:hypothetical protein
MNVKENIMNLSVDKKLFPEIYIKENTINLSDTNLKENIDLPIDLDKNYINDVFIDIAENIFGYVVGWYTSSFRTILYTDFIYVYYSYEGFINSDSITDEFKKCINKLYRSHENCDDITYFNLSRSSTYINETINIIGIDKSVKNNIKLSCKYIPHNMYFNIRKSIKNNCERVICDYDKYHSYLCYILYEDKSINDQMKISIYTSLPFFIDQIKYLFD